MKRTAFFFQTSIKFATYCNFYFSFACTEVIVVKEVIANSLFGCIFSNKAYGFNFSNFFKLFNFHICES